MKNFYFNIILVAFAFSVNAQTNIPDNSNVSGIWTVTNSPYIIQGRAVVPSGQTLIIEPGVEVKFTSSSSPSTSWFDFTAGNVGVIRVQGEILANGTSSIPILFTRNGSSGNWGTILIDENANTNSSFTNCIFEYSKETRNVPGITSVVAFGGGLSLYRTGINVTNNIFRHNNINGMYIVEVNNSFNFANNTFHNNGSFGLVVEQSSNIKCKNSTFYANSLSATGIVSAIRSASSNCYFVGNLIYNNDDFGIFTTSSGNNYLINNTIYSNSQGIRVENGANTYIYNCIIQNNTLNFATSSPGGAVIQMRNSLTNTATFPANVNDLGANILNSNAQFVNPTANDYSLQSNSPCINAGYSDTTGLNLPALDIIGNPRINNLIIDIGAVEYQMNVGVLNANNFNDISIYPNPATEIINISHANLTNAEIYTLNGRKLCSFKTNTLDISNITAGLYVLKIHTTDGKIIHKQFIKK